MNLELVLRSTNITRENVSLSIILLTVKAYRYHVADRRIQLWQHLNPDVTGPLYF